jgi:hypothetical protein
MHVLPAICQNVKHILKCKGKCIFCKGECTFSFTRPAGRVGRKKFVHLCKGLKIMHTAIKTVTNHLQNGYGQGQQIGSWPPTLPSHQMISSLQVLKATKHTFVIV